MTKKKSGKEVWITIFYDLSDTVEHDFDDEICESMTTDDFEKIIEIISALKNRGKVPVRFKNGNYLCPIKSVIFTASDPDKKEFVSEWERLSKLVEGTSWDFRDVVLDENGNLTRDEDGNIIRKERK